MTGVHREDVGDGKTQPQPTASGAVHVIYGSAAGLTADGSLFFNARMINPAGPSAPLVLRV